MGRLLYTRTAEQGENMVFARRNERREKMLQKRAASLHGEGQYVFQNITGAELLLSRPTMSGRTRVGPREKFIGDSYYKSMKEVTCLQEVQPVQEQKLLTEIPPAFTNEGQVEYVQQPAAAKPLTETDRGGDKEPAEDVLLNEAKREGIRIMR